MIKKMLKNNNAGFSLVELIVAIAILSFVIAPMLYSFIVSQRISNRGFSLGEATLVSRNVVETIRADGVESIIDRIDTGIPGIFGPGSSEDASYPGRIWDEDKGEYEFLMRNIPAGTMGLTDIGVSTDMTFDAVIRMDASVFKRLSDTDPLEINDMLISEYIPMDGMFHLSDNPDDLALEVLEERLIQEGITVANPSDYLNRTIELHAYRDSGDVIVTVTYKYVFEHPLHPPLPASLRAFDIEYFDIYWDTYDAAYPITIYLFYRPNYGGADWDTIEIKNLDMLDLTVFVIKQKPLDMTDPSHPDYPVDPLVSQARESSYRAQILRNENAVLQPSSVPDRTNVITNFRQNFFNPDSVNALNFRQRVRYGNSGGYVTVSTPTDELVSQTSVDRMFSVHIEVYRQWEPGAELLAVFDATHLD